MRVQRKPPVTVVLASVSTTSDMGNEETTATGTRITGAIFYPEQIAERTGNDQTPVSAPARFELPGVYDIDADDLIHVTEDALPTDPEALHTFLLTSTDDTWQVIGGGSVWRDRTAVPVEQARGV